MARDYENQPPTAFQRMPERQRDDAWIRAFLQKAAVGHIASTWDDQPFITPLSFCYDEKTNALYFHGSLVGRLRSNLARNPKVCVEVSVMGNLLPANTAFEFSLQYRSVVVFGTARLVEDPAEARRVLYQLISKYFPAMTAGKEYREITDKELRATAVYAVQIESWSGKESWKDRAKQSDEWAMLDEEWFDK